MASTTARIAIVIDAVERGVASAAARARAAIAGLRAEVERQDKVMSKVGTSLAVFAKGLAAISALTGAVQIVAGVTVALQNLLPIGLLLPAALLGVAGAFATLKIGMSGVGDAIKSGDISKLAPQAGQAVTAIRGLSGEFDKLKRSVQDALFKNFAADVKALGAIYLPLLKSRLTQIATSFNEMGRSVAFALTRPRTSDDISIVLVNTAKLLHNARNAAGAFISGFTGLGAIGATYLPRLGVAIDGVAQKFQRWVDTAGSDGRIRAMIDGAIAGFKTLGQIAGNVGSILRSVFTGLSSGGLADPLAKLQELTAALAEFLKTAQAQDALKALGDAFRAISDAVQGVLLEALKQLAPIITDLAPVVASIATSFGTLLVNALREVGPLIEGFARVLRDNKEIVTIVADALLLLYGRFLLFKGITAAVAAIRAVVTALGGLRGLGLAGLAVAIGAVAIELDKLNVAAAPGGDTEKSGGLADTLHNIVEAGKQLASGDISGIVAKIKGEVAQTNATWAAGQAPIQQWFDKVKTSFETDFIGVFAAIPAQIGGFFTSVGTTISTAVSTWFTGVRESFQRDFLDVFAALPGQIGTIFANIGTTIATTASNLWTGFLTTVQVQFAPVIAFFSQTPYQMGFAIGSGIGAIISAALSLMTAFGDAVNQGITNVLTFFTNLPNQIAVSLAQLGSTIFTTVTTAMTQFGDAVNQGITNVINFFTGVPGQVGSALAPLPGQVIGVATNAGTGFLTNVTNFFNNAVVFLSQIPGRAVAAIASIVGFMVQKATEMGQGFLNAATTTFNNVISFIAGIPGRILSALGNLGSLLVNAGRSVIDGLLSGIRAGVQAMYDFVSGIAAGIAARKGPLSYDKVVLKPAGLALMQGLLNGLKQGNAQVQAYVGTIADGIADAASTGGLIASARLATASVSSQGANSTAGITSTSAPLPVTIPIHIGDEVVRVVRTEIDTSNRDVRRTVRAGAGVTAG